MKRALVAFAAVWLALAVRPAPAGTVLFSAFDSLEGWSVRSVGAADARIVRESDSGEFAEVTSWQGTIFLSRELPLEDVAGARMSVRCLVKSKGIVAGPQLSSTGKIDLAVVTPSPEGPIVAHYNARFTGDSEWHSEGFSTDVPKDAQRVVLNLGLEACQGKTCFDRLVVRNDRRAMHPLDLSETVNAGHEQLGIGAFPSGTLRWQSIPFEIMNADEHDGNDCFRLRGQGHEDWPENTASPIPVETGATTIYILHGALGGREMSETPAAIWSAKFVGGQDYGLSVFGGREIGAVGQTEDAENWHVAWRGQTDDGKPVTFGVTKWTVYSDAPLESLSCRAYSGAPTVVLAVTAVEEPPAPPVDIREVDEMGEPLGEE